MGTCGNFGENNGGGESGVLELKNGSRPISETRIEEKLLWGAYRKSSILFRLFGSPLYFYFRFCLYGH